MATKDLQTKEHKLAFNKMHDIMMGKRVISNDIEMNLMLEIDDTFFYDVVSIHNPKRLGLLDQYIVYVKTLNDD